MNIFYYFVLGTLICIILLATSLSFYFRNRLKNMAGMVLSMTIGMNVGLTAGLLFGTMLQGNLYLSTLLAILAGVIGGAICGLGFGVYAFLEGLMAGLMGGMMGAMLGEMVSTIQAHTLINIFLTLSVSSLLLFPALRIQTKTKEIANRIWYTKPAFAFLLLSGILIFGSQFSKVQVQSESNISKPEDKFQLPSDIQPENAMIRVQATNFLYNPQKIIVKEGEQTSITLDNLDSVEHDIEIKEFPVEKTEVGHAGHGENSPDFHLHAHAKDTTTVVFTPLQKGTYEFYCTIPGHKEAGMTGVIVVI